ncbi:hypothetical protein [Paractinoplanes lichenicola]|uniref:Uncharacterized protein n=1 Tax=Paractinoplanes lichenicola TaxID=2802976 RepID=A0ABS1VFM8_9ACTN|nr:hypothetical protein [Actinoplanes lichenicola]MBL7252974.1 hypothetical protein [Actinoplanes lichenicola]
MPSEPAAALAAAKASLGRESARFAQVSVNDRIDYTGVVDAATRNWEIVGKEFVVRRVGQVVYTRVSGSILAEMPAPPETTDRLAAGGWLRTPLPVGHEYSVVFNDAFPWNLANPASRATGVRRVGDRAFAGTLAVKEGGKLRVRVDLDDRGRFTGIGLSDAANRKTTFTFAHFGLRADIAVPPPADVVEADSPFLLSVLGLT